MKLTYLGHSAFCIKGQQGTVVTDPFDDPDVGVEMKKIAADIVTVSHAHTDHNAISKVTETARRDKPFVIDAPGEYEVGGISVFGHPTNHDTKDGAERGHNIVFSFQIDDVVVTHLGDLGHDLNEEMIDELGRVDVLLCPIGEVFTLGTAALLDVIQAISPSYIVPMHFKTASSKGQYAQLKTVEDFMKAWGAIKEPLDVLNVTQGSLPEETELIVLKPSST